MASKKPLEKEEIEQLIINSAEKRAEIDARLLRYTKKPLNNKQVDQMLKDSAEKLAELDESLVKWDPRMCEYFLSRDFPIPISCAKEKR